MRFLDLVSVVSSETMSVAGVHVEMSTFEFIVILVMVDQVRDKGFLVVTTLVG
jgi:hypothetical protein